MEGHCLQVGGNVGASHWRRHIEVLPMVLRPAGKGKRLAAILAWEIEKNETAALGRRPLLNRKETA